MDEITLGTQRLLASFRARGFPSSTRTTHRKPAAIDDRIATQPGEHVIVKKRASAFHGTHLSGLLKATGVDTVMITRPKPRHGLGSADG